MARCRSFTWINFSDSETQCILVL